VKLDFRNHFRGNRFLGENICEIICDLVWVHLLNLAPGELNQALEARDVSIAPFDRDQVDEYAVLFSQAAHFFIEGVRLQRSCSVRTT